MTNAPLPRNEGERLEALQAYDVLDTPPEEAFDDIVRIASLVFDAPIVLVSLIDEHRQWFKAAVGLPVRETSRDIAFCAHAILDDQVMVVENAAADERFRANPLVTGEPHIRFYAGAPLLTDEGLALGTLCVIDRTPRAITPSQREVLRALGRRVVAELELRRASATIREHSRNLERLFNRLGEGVIALDPVGNVTFVDRTAAQLLAVHGTESKGRPWEDVLALDVDSTAAVRKLLGGDPGASARIRSPHADAVVDVRAAAVPGDPNRTLLLLSDVTELEHLRDLLGLGGSKHGLVGSSPAMRDVVDQIQRIAVVDIPVLISGETGTGKEIAARAIHTLSHRGEKPFVAVNCAALSESLLGSQLFGHRRGAFTGAVQDHEGLFEAVKGGTVFLDEIGDMPLPLQASLLRVLEVKEVVRLGDSRPRPVDFRLLSASNQDLRRQIQEGKFREDLYYRIWGAGISMPSLRTRREDIPQLAFHFAAASTVVLGTAEPPVFSDEAITALMDHDWPGNVRELRSVVNFAVLHSTRGVVRLRDLPPHITAARVTPLPPDTPRIPRGDRREAVLQALALAAGNRSQAAKLLGVSRATFYRRLKQLGIDQP